MEVKNCKECGRLFNYLTGPRLCGECRKKMEDKFLEVRNYIYDNPSASITDISQDNDVSTQQIRQWIREERLIFTADSMVTIDCEKCGAPIKTGRFCEKCKSEMAKGLQSMYQSSAPSAQKKDREKDRMRFLDN